jgi:predicted amidohydrolase
MDIHFVETARIEGLEGVDVICHISNWLAERAPAPYWISRAVENGCYVIESNRWGLERTVQFSGGTCIIEPDGAIAAVIDSGDGICYGEIDLARSRRREVFGEPVFAQRRPGLYADLMNNTYLWNPYDYFRLYGHRPLPAGKRSVVSVAQMAPCSDPRINLSQMMALARLAKARDGAGLVVFPELALTGLDDPGARAITEDDALVGQLQQFALEQQLHLAFGMAEKEGKSRYNTALLLGPQGLAGKYRKIHLTEADRAWASAGHDWTVCDLPLGRVGLMIGHDASFPEAGRVLALMGCDLLACPSRQRASFTGSHGGSAVGQNYPIPTGRDPLHWHFYRTRAGENNVYLAFANSFDEASGKGGRSGVFGPDTYAFPRQEAVVIAGEGIASSLVDTSSLPDSRYPTNVVRRKDLVLMRLPHHYRSLVLTQPDPAAACTQLHN